MTETRRLPAWIPVLTAAFIAIALLGGGHALLRDRMVSNRQQAELQPLLQALPEALRAHVTLREIGSLDDADMLGLRTATAFYRAERNGETLGWLLPAIARHGYNGDIALIIAIDAHGAIIGTHVLAQRETSGLGDRVERSRSSWLDGFTGRSLHDPTAGAWYVARDGGKFDQITGATTTSRAVTQAIRQTLMYFHQHRDIITAAQPAVESDDE